MKKVNCIRIFFILTVLFFIGCYQTANLITEEPSSVTETEEFQVDEVASETEVITLPVNKTINHKFLIVEESDYLTVYYADHKTIYEYTNIRYSDLEDSLRQKIRKGYYIKDERTLFGFLENYSS